MIKRKTLLALICGAVATVANAGELTICDFENYAVGDIVPMHDIYNGDTESTAVVTTDPAGGDNKVLHVQNASWNTLVKLPLKEITGAELTEDYSILAFDLYRPASEERDNYRMFIARIGEDNIYFVENDFKHQGATSMWVAKSYIMTPVTNSSTDLYIGYNSIDMEYYIDNVRVVSLDDSYDMENEEETLRYHAALCGKNIGCAVPVWRLNINNDDDNRTATIYNNFSMVVAENEMKMESLQPNKGNFSYYNGDCLTNMAERHDIEVRGHTLVWHSQAPKWVSKDGYANDHGYTRDELLSIMEDHITNVLTHYKGKAVEWDVVNECLDDDQSIVRTNPRAYNLRKSVWYNVIGEDYLDSAFVYAKRVDPDIKLYINDYGVEFKGDAKTEAYYNLVKALIARDVPVEGVGFQSHVHFGIDVAKFENNIKRYADLGVECSITELDITVDDPSNPNDLMRQGDDYASLARMFLKYDHCKNFMVWGLTDDMSWRGNAPLLFNSDLTPKYAFFALRNVFAQHAAQSSVDDIIMDAVVPEQSPYVDVYDMMGRLVRHHIDRSEINNLAPGFYIIDRKKVLIR